MKTDMKTFVNSCLHCVSTTGGFRERRPMAQTLHSDTPNEIIHFDSPYMEATSDDLAYVLIIMHDASSFAWLETYKDSDAASAVDLLLRLLASFGVVCIWVSDRGSHFKNEGMAGLNKIVAPSPLFHHASQSPIKWHN